jgi:uncharacterized membrane protein (DUF485 family)
MTPTKDYSAIYKTIGDNPKYKELIGRRARFSIMLSAIVLISYYAFMAVVAFAPSLLATPISDSGALSVGWPIGAALVFVYWLLTGWYINRANGEFEKLNQDLLKEVGR